ncbi:hypothetical protein J4Q44_G00393510 [Coregonus suidteri]|uniref:PARP12-like CCCH zinc finger tandem domain-containing protein n=1 Tax=Coregonus suidteri TaxID=861788 RepID=A0AAN8QBJ6_9TELE
MTLPTSVIGDFYWRSSFRLSSYYTVFAVNQGQQSRKSLRDGSAIVKNNLRSSGNIGLCRSGRYWLWGRYICALDKLVENDLFSIAECNGNKRIFAKTKVRRCKAQQCDGCNDLHLCKFYLFGDCKNSRGRRTCRFGHDLHSEHNSIVLREHKLETLSRQELRQLLLQNDNSLLPPVRAKRFPLPADVDQ